MSILKEILQETMYVKKVDIIPQVLSVEFQTLSKEERLKALKEIEQASQTGDNSSVLAINKINLTKALRRVFVKDQTLTFDTEEEKNEFIETLEENMFRKIYDEYVKFMGEIQKEIEIVNPDEIEFSEEELTKVLESILLQSQYVEEYQISDDFPIAFKSLNVKEREEMAKELDEYLKEEKPSKLRLDIMIQILNLKYSLIKYGEEELDPEGAYELLLGLDENIFDYIYNFYLKFQKKVNDALYKKSDETVKNS